MTWGKLTLAGVNWAVGAAEAAVTVTATARPARASLFATHDPPHRALICLLLSGCPDAGPADRPHPAACPRNEDTEGGRGKSSPKVDKTLKKSYGPRTRAPSTTRKLGYNRATAPERAIGRRDRWRSDRCRGRTRRWSSASTTAGTRTTPRSLTSPVASSWTG